MHRHKNVMVNMLIHPNHTIIIIALFYPSLSRNMIAIRFRKVFSHWWVKEEIEMIDVFLQWLIPSASSPAHIRSQSLRVSTWHFIYLSLVFISVFFGLSILKLILKDVCWRPMIFANSVLDRFMTTVWNDWMHCAILDPFSLDVFGQVGFHVIGH